MRQEQLPDVAQRDLCDEDGWVTGDLFDLEGGCHPRKCGETSAAASPAFAPHPLNRAEILRPYAGEAVALQDVAEFVFAEHMGPDVR